MLAASCHVLRVSPPNKCLLCQMSTDVLMQSAESRSPECGLGPVHQSTTRHSQKLP